MRDVVATEYHFACIGMFETGGEAEQRCLTAATWAKQSEEFRWIYRQAELAKNGLPVKALGDVLKFKNRRHCWKTRTVLSLLVKPPTMRSCSTNNLEKLICY